MHFAGGGDAASTLQSNMLLAPDKINQSINQYKKNSIDNACSYPPRRPYALCSTYTRSETKGKWNTERVEHTDREVGHKEWDTWSRK